MINKNTKPNKRCNTKLNKRSNAKLNKRAEMKENTPRFENFAGNPHDCMR